MKSEEIEIRLIDAAFTLSVRELPHFFSWLFTGTEQKALGTLWQSNSYDSNFCISIMPRFQIFSHFINAGLKLVSPHHAFYRPYSAVIILRILFIVILGKYLTIYRKIDELPYRHTCIDTNRVHA